jgi:hypothetical protein
MQPRETLYHKTVEMAWLTKMMIGKVSSEMEESRWKDNSDHNKMLDEILSRLSSLETITKLLVEVEKDHKSNMEWLAFNFTSICVMSTTWTSHQPMDRVRQPTSGRLAQSPRRRRTRTGWMTGRNTSSS